MISLKAFLNGEVSGANSVRNQEEPCINEREGNFIIVVLNASIH